MQVFPVPRCPLSQQTLGAVSSHAQASRFAIACTRVFAIHRAGDRPPHQTVWDKMLAWRVSGKVMDRLVESDNGYNSKVSSHLLCLCSVFPHSKHLQMWIECSSLVSSFSRKAHESRSLKHGQTTWIVDKGFSVVRDDFTRTLWILLYSPTNQHVPRLLFRISEPAKNCLS